MLWQVFHPTYQHGNALQRRAQERQIHVQDLHGSTLFGGELNTPPTYPFKEKDSPMQKMQNLAERRRFSAYGNEDM
jgi:hypothetical protein